MAVRVRVQNFQSIADAEITVDGLTAITGPNNTGKSAMLRAIRGVFQNTPGTHFVRHGAEKCVVELTFDDGRKLRWEKGPKVRPTYVINDGEPIYPGQGVPDEVKAFGVAPIIAGGREVWPQIAPQMVGQVFLLDEPGSVLAEAVANVDRVGRLNRSLKAAESDRRAAAGELKVRRADLLKYEDEVARYDGLDPAVVEVEALEEAARQAERVGKAVQGLTALRDRVTKARDLVASLLGIEAIEVPTPQGEEKTLASLEEAEKLLLRVTKARDLVLSLEGAAGIEVPPTGDEAKTLDGLEAAEGLRTRFVRARRLVSKLSGVQEIEVGFDEKPAEKFAGALKTVETFRDRREGAIRKVTDLEKRLKELQAQLEGATSDTVELLGDLGECPTCGKVADHEAHP